LGLNNISNCPKCGKVFVKSNISDICQSCVRELDLQCENVLKYLKEHRGITLQQLSDETGVPLGTIAKFMREGRISIMHAPNISYPCEVCGVEIREKSMCASCLQKLRKDYSNTREDEKRAFDREEDSRRQQKLTAFKITDRLQERKK